MSECKTKLVETLTEENKVLRQIVCDLGSYDKMAMETMELERAVQDEESKKAFLDKLAIIKAFADDLKKRIDEVRATILSEPENELSA